MAIIFILSAFAQGGVVQTLDGKSYSGDVKLSGGSDHRHAGWRGGGESRLIRNSQRATERGCPRRRGGSAVDRARHRLAAGAGDQRGSWAQNVIIRGGGAEIGMDRDEGYFVYQQLAGDGQISARVDSIGKTNVLAKAGVMIRGNLDALAVRACDDSGQ